MVNPIEQRLLNQHLAVPRSSDPAEVVAHMGAMQAQEYRLMRWAVAMRTAHPSAAQFQKAYDEGRIIRLHLLRGTWQLVSGEDYGWMLELCSAKGKSVIKGWMKSNKIDIPDDELLEIRELLQNVANGRSVTKEDFVEALVQSGKVMDDHRLSYHIRFAELDGVLCSGDLHPSKATYTLTSQKIKPSAAVDRDEALMRLARKYFQSHSPATLEDYVWWSGMSLGDCRKGIALLKDDLHLEHWQGRDFYCWNSSRSVSLSEERFVLLPSYDEYLIAYKSRDVALAAENAHLAHSKNGIFFPVVLRNGVVCGNWKPFQKELDVSSFDEGQPLPDLSLLWNEYQMYKSR